MKRKKLSTEIYLVSLRRQNIRGTMPNKSFFFQIRIDNKFVSQPILMVLLYQSSFFALMLLCVIILDYFLKKKMHIKQ